MDSRQLGNWKNYNALGIPRTHQRTSELRKAKVTGKGGVLNWKVKNASHTNHIGLFMQEHGANRDFGGGGFPGSK